MNRLTHIPRRIRFILFIAAALLILSSVGCNNTGLVNPPQWLSAEDVPTALRIQKVEQALDKRLSVGLSEASLNELIASIQLSVNTPMLVDTEELRQGGFDLTRRVDLALYQVTALEALEASIDLFRDDTGRPEVDYRITPQGITVGTIFSDSRVPFDRHSSYSAWNLLRQTELFAAAQTGQSGERPKPFTAMRALVEAPRGPAILYDLATDPAATWAGRLYALVGLYEADQQAYTYLRPMFEATADPVAVHIGTTYEVIPVRDAVLYVPQRFAPEGPIGR